MVYKILLILLFPLSLFSQMDDRDKHMFAGNIISTGVGVTTYQLTNKPFLSVSAGFVSGVLAGILKEEVYDKRWGKGVYSKTDMYDTTWGSTVGSIIVIVYIDVKRKHKFKRFD